MHKDPATMSVYLMRGSTEKAKGRVRDLLEHADAVRNDARKAERLERHECKACFYASRWGGSTIVDQDCMCCGQTQTYSSTATSVLCLACAEKHNLCRHCGGDISMRVGRRQWPEPSPNRDR